MGPEWREEGENEYPSLKTAELNVLLALAGSEAHGYGIRKDVEGRTEGRVRLGPGALYRALDVLLGRGWVEEAGVEEDGGRRRRYYRITAPGRRAAAAEVGRLEETVAQARERGIIGRTPRPATDGAP